MKTNLTGSKEKNKRGFGPVQKKKEKKKAWIWTG
jgi:hypothetical protein